VPAATAQAAVSLWNVSAGEVVKKLGTCDIMVGAIGVALTLFTRGTALQNGEGAPDQEDAARATEDALIGKILSGHTELFMELVRPYQRTVYATALSLLANKDDAEDVVQNALLKGFSRLSQFRRESAFGTWLIQITINEVRMKWRRDRRVEMISLGHTSDDDANYVPRDFQDWREIPSEALERAEVRETLLKALASIAQHYREAFVLRDIQELTITETASVLGISRGAVKTRLRRARLMLRDILAPGLGQDGRLGWCVREVTKPWE
jgi:RNA polymerase sigma-70 factor (ECF subfamily)